MKARIPAVLALCAVLASGCAFMRDNPDVARVGVVVATAKFIRLAGEPDEQAQRRARVLKVAAEVQQYAAGESVTVGLLKAVALARLPQMLPEERLLVELVIDAVAAELLARVGEGDLAADRLLELDRVLAWVIEGAVLTEA